MKNDISNIMGKLSGAELGRLFIKDEIGIMAGINRTYSRDDFDMATTKMDRSDVLKYLDCWHLSKELLIMCLNHWHIHAKLSQYVTKLQVLQFHSFWVESFDETQKILAFERFKNHFADEVSEDKIFYRDSYKRMVESIEAKKEDTNEFQYFINGWIVLYLNSYELLKETANRLKLPEIETIAGDMSVVDSIIEKINELRDIKLYKSFFQAVDIEELKKIKHLDVKKKVDELMTWLD